MNHIELLEVALREAGLTGRIAGRRSLSGGCIHDVARIELSNGMTVVAKVAPAHQASWLEEERDGLRALHATNTVCVPEPMALVHRETASVLLTSELAPAQANDAAWRHFGEDLARLHQHDAGKRYGFQGDNHIGSTPQPNRWHDDWVEFNRTCRLGHQVNLARRSNLLSPGEARSVERVIERLDQCIPRTPKPALLHGDLWSGNALSTTNAAGESRIGVIDPACSVGDGWADMAMMQLFGGFPQACIEAYASNVSDQAQRETRIAVYQLYHVLNHVNIFGRSYVAQAMSIARSLTD